MKELKEWIKPTENKGEIIELAQIENELREEMKFYFQAQRNMTGAEESMRKSKNTIKKILTGQNVCCDSFFIYDKNNLYSIEMNYESNKIDITYICNTEDMIITP